MTEVVQCWTRNITCEGKSRSMTTGDSQDSAQRSVPAATLGTSRSVLRLTLPAAMLSLAALQASGQALAPEQGAVLEQYCVSCHNYEDWAGAVAFDTANHDNLQADSELWEKTLVKLRSGLMPPAGEARPAPAVIDALVINLEQGLDAGNPTHPGPRPLGRLNRSEYTNAVRDLLQLDADQLTASLPDESSGEGFDNAAERLALSPTLLEAYLNLAMELSRQAVGDPAIGATDIHYRRKDRGVQDEHIDGLAPGTRGGMTVRHHFPLDAEYVFRISANLAEAGWSNDEGRLWWCAGPAVELLVDGRHIEVDNPLDFRLQVAAGPHDIAVVLLDRRNCAGIGELYLGEALASVGGAIDAIEIQGPFNASGAGTTPSRRQIFRCQPGPALDEENCTREILSQLASRGWRRLVQADDPALAPLLEQYALARSREGGSFELGIQHALARLLVDPQFLFKFEAEPAGLAAGTVHAVDAVALASRLSFFLWSSIPDDTLLELAFTDRLIEPAVLAAQVHRMLADPKAEALTRDFAGQWLKLRTLEDVAPQDREFDEDLRRALRQETELLFSSVLHSGASVLTLLDADYTFLNERLAKHYGIAGVRGSWMRRVELPPDSPRRGLLGHGSILTVTSIPNRTSPVVRGVWVVENLLGAHVPDPPPGVETNLEESSSVNALPSTLRARLEQHRADPVCGSCHGIMDPIGLALENFDLTGRWRSHDKGLPIDASSALVDGTALQGVADLRQALLARPNTFISTFAGKLLSYALGRDLQYSDGPALRAILREAATDNHSFEALVQALVTSVPFRLRVAAGSAEKPTPQQTAEVQR